MALVAIVAVAAGGCGDDDDDAVVLDAGDEVAGRSHDEVFEEFTRYLISGDEATSPLVEPACSGEVLDGVFFLPPSTAEGVELSCDVPSGVPIAVLVSGTFCTGQDLESCEGDPLADLESSTLTVDGVDVDLAGHRFDTGEIDAELAEGNVLGDEPGPTTARNIADFVVLDLADGAHTVRAATFFAATEDLPEFRADITYSLEVG